MVDGFPLLRFVFEHHEEFVTEVERFIAQNLSVTERNPAWTAGILALRDGAFDNADKADEAIRALLLASGMPEGLGNGGVSEAQMALLLQAISTNASNPAAIAAAVVAKLPAPATPDLGGNFKELGDNFGTAMLALQSLVGQQSQQFERGLGELTAQIADNAQRDAALGLACDALYAELNQQLTYQINAFKLSPTHTESRIRVVRGLIARAESVMGLFHSEAADHLSSKCADLRSLVDSATVGMPPRPVPKAVPPPPQPVPTTGTTVSVTDAGSGLTPTPAPQVVPPSTPTESPVGPPPALVPPTPPPAQAPVAPLPEPEIPKVDPGELEDLIDTTAPVEEGGYEEKEDPDETLIASLPENLRRMIEEGRQAVNRGKGSNSHLTDE